MAIVPVSTDDLDSLSRELTGYAKDLKGLQDRMAALVPGGPVAANGFEMASKSRKWIRQFVKDLDSRLAAIEDEAKKKSRARAESPGAGATRASPPEKRGRKTKMS